MISNEVPSDTAKMIEEAERGDVAAARAIHHRLLPLMLANFVESNPVPVKAAMAAMGLLEEVFRLPLVGPRPESREKILNTLRELGLLTLAKGASSQRSRSCVRRVRRPIAMPPARRLRVCERRCRRAQCALRSLTPGARSAGA